VRARRDGVVLLLALLCVLALEVAAAGLHFITTQELRTATAAERALRLRLAAHSAAAQAVAQWPADGIADLPLFGSRPVNLAGTSGDIGIHAAAQVERVAANLFLVRATAASDFRETASVGILVATATASDVAHDLAFALRTNGPVDLGAGARIAAAASDCYTSATPPHAIEMGGNANLAISGGALQGSVADTSATLDTRRIGSLDYAGLRRAGVAAPAPGRTTVVYHDGDLALAPADGNGVLVVNGDLTLRGGTFEGIVMVTGSLTLIDNASITGAVLVDRGPTRLENSRITWDGCIILAVVADPRLQGPFRPLGRSWIALF
jgi:hypothetical protein